MQFVTIQKQETVKHMDWLHPQGTAQKNYKKAPPYLPAAASNTIKIPWTFPKSPKKWTFPSTTEPRHDDAVVDKPAVIPVNAGVVQDTWECTTSPDTDKDKHDLDGGSLASSQQDSCSFGCSFDQVDSDWAVPAIVDQDHYPHTKTPPKQGKSLGYLKELVEELLRCNSCDGAACALVAISQIMYTFKNRASQQEKNRLIWAGGCLAVVRAMNKYPDAVQIQLNACDVIADMVLDHEESKAEIVATGGIAALVNAMLHFPGNQGVQFVACWALNDLLVSSSCFTEYDMDEETSSLCTEAGGIQALVAAIQAFPRDASICFGACSCLIKLVQENRNSVELSIKAGAIQAVSNMLVTSNNVKDIKMASKDMQQTALSLMGHLATLELE